MKEQPMKPSRSYRGLVFILLILSLISLIVVSQYSVSVDISRPPMDVGCADEKYPNYNYDEIYRNVYLSSYYYGFTHAGNGSSAYFKYDLGENYGATFDKVGPFSLDMTYWVEGFEGEVFRFNITIWEVKSNWNGYGVDHNHRPDRIAKVGEMELTGIGERVEPSVFVYLDIELTESDEFIAFEITSDIENASIGFGFEDPDYVYDPWDEDYYDYNYYDESVGIYYDEPHLLSENLEFPPIPWWYYTTLIGCAVIVIGSIIFLIFDRDRPTIF